MNVFILTCKGRKDLTEACFRSMSSTLGVLTQDALMIVVDAARGQDALTHDDVRVWLAERMPVIYTQWPNCTLTSGWNYAIDSLRTILPADYRLDQVNVYLMQNDAIFLKEGWLTKLEDALTARSVGTIGTSGMSVFGYSFVTGVIQGFRLSDGLAVAENGKVIDGRFNHAYPDVDLSIRFTKAGYRNYRVPGMEYGEDPYIKHLVSATMYSEHGVDKTLEMRASEEQIFLEKWGKNN